MTHRGPFQLLPFCDSVINNKKRPKENLCPLLDARGNIVKKDKEKLRYLMPSFPQSLVVRPVVPWVPSPLSWKTGTGTE